MDDGSFAITSQVVRFAAGKTQVVSLTPNPSHAADGWLGELPTERGAEAHLVWVGADGTPIDEALALLDVEVYRASHYDAATDRWQSYTPGGPSFRQTYLSRATVLAPTAPWPRGPQRLPGPAASPP